MPTTEKLFIAKAKKIKRTLKPNPRPLSLENTTQTIRQFLKDTPFSKLKVLVFVWLFKHLTGNWPEIDTAIHILNVDSLNLTQSQIIEIITGLIKSEAKMLRKTEHGNCIKIDSELLKALDS